MGGEDFASQEESGTNFAGKVASVVHVLSSGAGHAVRSIAVAESIEGGGLTISLEVGDVRSASRATSTSRSVDTGEETRSRKRKQNKRKRKKNKKRRRRSPSGSSG